jgi:hypothetical protein
VRGLNAHFILESTMKTVSNRRSAALRNHLVPAALVTGIASSAWGADRLVPGQYASIQAAIDAAAHGDRVLVSPGTHGAFALGGKAITIRGEGPAGSVVIDALGVGRAVDASGVAVGEAILENLVIRNASLASSGPVGGAGIDAASSRLALIEVRVENCSVTWTGTGMFQTQGAGLRASDSAVRIERCVFAGNVTAANNQGNSFSQGLAYGSAIAVRGGSLSVVQSDIVGNSAIATTVGTSWHDVQARGAGIYADGADVVIVGSRVNQNLCSATQLTSGVASCQAMGGGLFVRPGPKTSTTVRNCEFSGNQLLSRSSTVYDSLNYNATHGGGIRLAGTALVEDCTIVGNTAAGGLQAPADSAGGGIHVGPGSVTISRCVIRDNAGGDASGAGQRSGGGIAVAGGSVTIDGSHVCGNAFDQVSISGGGTVSQTGESCVANRCNACPQSCPGDFNQDAFVDGADLGVLLNAWGPCSGACVADLDRDGFVDGSDLGALLGGWGQCAD